MRRPFPGAVGLALVFAVTAALPACDRTATARVSPPPPVRLRLNGDVTTVVQGTTFAGLVADRGLVATDGRLLSVTGDVLRQSVTPGKILLNGREWVFDDHVLHAGDHVDVIDGPDRTEPTIRETTMLPGWHNGDPQRTLTRYRIRRVTVVGDISGDVADVLERPVGRGRTPKAVALTFDDGPWPDATLNVLRILRHAHARATFFMVGSLVDEHRDLVRAVRKAGMPIGDHSFTHPIDPPFADLPGDRISMEIDETAQALRAAGATPHWFRPPGGSWSESVVAAADAVHLRTVLWSVDPQDWRSDVTAREVARRVLDRIKPGSIVLLHDGGGDAAHTIAALPTIIRGIRKRGLRLVTLHP